MSEAASTGAAGNPAAENPVVLVVGANGFLGGYIVSALRRQGCRVLGGVRSPRASDERACDLTNLDAQAIAAAFAGVDVVVNAAGILRENGGQTFQAVHADGPLSLARACIHSGVSRFVQVSALGIPADGEFIAAKHRFDAELLALPLSSVVLRPSVVYSVSGSYGGTSLLRALAAMPGAQWLPGAGQWLVQPVAVEDLAELVARAACNDAVGIHEVGGPAPILLRDYQSSWRRWLRIPGQRAIHVPEWLVSAQVWLWERIGSGPVGMTMWRMLRRGNVTAPDASQRLQAAFGMSPRALDAALEAQPSQVQDRWQAQLYFLAPALRIAVVALWLLSALAGFLTPASEILQMAGDSALQQSSPVFMARTSGVLDAVLALWLASGWRPRGAIIVMALSVLVYTALLGAMIPALWLDPLGGLAKNLVILPALAVLWVLAERR